jgi:hypothetical protein
MKMEALGRLFDIGTGWAPVDLTTAGATGKRVFMGGATGVSFVVFLGAAASGTEDVVLTLQQHTAYTGGTSSNLATCDHYYLKAEATLDNDESWTKVTQTASQTVTIAGATYATQQAIAVIPVGADSLSDGYAWASVNVADPGSVARLGACLYLPHDLASQRAAANLPNLLRPGVANA